MAGEVITWENGPEFEAAIARLLELINDLRPFWPLVVPLFVRWMGKQFETEGEYFGEHWAPLTEQYATWKSLHYPTKGILSAEGDLRKAATTPRREVTPGMLVLTIEAYEKTERSEALTSSGRQSRKRVGTGKTMDPSWFQEGTDRMPARPLLSETLPEDAQRELSTAAEFYFQENARKLGLLASD